MGLPNFPYCCYSIADTHAVPYALARGYPTMTPHNAVQRATSYITTAHLSWSHPSFHNGSTSMALLYHLLQVFERHWPPGPCVVRSVRFVRSARRLDAVFSRPGESGPQWAHPAGYVTVQTEGWTLTTQASVNFSY